MPDAFTLLDLPSQARAVQRHLAGRTEAEKLAWLAARGFLSPVESRVPGARTVHLFESAIGLECCFFLDGDVFVFIGDHTTWTAE